MLRRLHGDWALISCLLASLYWWMGGYLSCFILEIVKRITMNGGSGLWLKWATHLEKTSCYSSTVTVQITYIHNNNKKLEEMGKKTCSSHTLFLMASRGRLLWLQKDLIVQQSMLKWPLNLCSVTLVNIFLTLWAQSLLLLNHWIKHDIN